MKRILFAGMFALLATTAGAQNLNKVKDLLKNKELDKAKEQIDAFLANAKNQKNVDALVVKAKIYGAIAANEQFRSLAPEGRTEALDAIKKAMEIDKNATQLQLTLDQYAPVFDLYTGYFDLAANQYNAEKFDDAFQNFKNANQVGSYIHSQGWGLSKLDTLLVYYSGLSAMNAKKEDSAAHYFRMLADANVGGKPEYAVPYRFLAKYYLDKKDDASVSKYVKAGKTQYPQDDYLPLVEFDMIRASGDKKALYAKYEEMIKANPTDYQMLLDYANEIFDETHTMDEAKRPADYKEKCAKIEALYQQAIKAKPESNEAKLNLGKHYYNQVLRLDDQIKPINRSTKPEDVKQKADFVAEQGQLIDRAIPIIEEVFMSLDAKEKLTRTEKAEYKSAANNLMYMYEKKKDKAKVDFFQKKYDEADSKG